MITMKNDNMQEGNYSKDIGKGTFLLEWVLALIVTIVFAISIWTVGDLIINILRESDFNIRWYLFNDSVLVNPEIPFLFAFVLSLFEGRKRQHLIKKEYFASITNEKLILNFGRKSFLWDDIQTVNLEGQKKLTVIFLEKEKRKKGDFDLKWLSRKRDLISEIKNHCAAKNIPFHETKLTLSSRMKLFSVFSLRYPYI